MRDATAVSVTDLCGADIHAAVLLHGVGIDDFSPEMFGQRQCEMGLTRSGGPDDGDGPGH